MDTDSSAAESTRRIIWPSVVFLVFVFSGLVLGVGFILMSPPTLGNADTGLIFSVIAGAAIIGFLLFTTIWAVTRNTGEAIPFQPIVICFTVLSAMLWGAIAFWGGNAWLPIIGQPKVETVELPVVGKIMQQSRRGRINYLIITLDPFDSWRPTSIKARPLLGGVQHWKRFTIGECAELRFRMGHFGMPIRAGFDPKQCSSMRGTAVVTDRVTVNIHPAEPAAWRWVESHEHPGRSSELSP